MKSVLISIQPKWCELIASGKKTVEVRKTRPKLETPFKVYIYCTSSNVHECLMQNEGDVKLIYACNYKTAIPCGGHIANGKVIGEFVCKRFVFLDAYYDTNGNRHLCNTAFMGNSCVTDDELFDYLYGKHGRKHGGWGWHISDLVMYDKPKELREFCTVDNEAVQKCENRFQTYYNFTDTGYIKNGFACSYKDEWCSKCKTKPITRPPQSWCYVEERSRYDRKKNIDRANN